MQSTGEAPPATILVVDDNEANRSLARHTLEDEGYRVVLATGGVEGIAQFEKNAIDCVLLDVRMPDLDGPETLAALRELDPAVRVVFMTGNTGPYTTEDLLALEPARVLEKPILGLAALAQTLQEVAQPKG